MGRKMEMGWFRFVGTVFAFVMVMSFSTAAGVHCDRWKGNAIVKTKTGKVRGFEDASATLAWKAIPYAKPPVGDLRWMATRSPDAWDGVRAETEFSDVCPQLYGDTENVVGSEDCLYLNVWRPNTGEVNLPVYVWIHGGGNSIGTAAEPSYNGAYFANRNNAVFVTFNYRLGPMGWFTHPALRSDQSFESADDDPICQRDARGNAKNNSGNYGTLDMIKALRWVRKNIKAFGGDKHNVTIAGESAGAHNVVSLLLSPLAKKLFHKAIAQSTPSPPGYPMAVADLSATQMLARLLVNDGSAASEQEAYGIISNDMSKARISAYLKSKTAAELIRVHDRLGFGMLAFPYIFNDGSVIPEEGSQAFETGTYPNKVPMMIGSTKDEMKLFLASDLEYIEGYFAYNYPGVFPQGAAYTITAQYNSELWKAKGTDTIARGMAAQPEQPDLFVFQFLWGADPSVVDPQLAFAFGSHHGRDVDFFLGNDGAVEASMGIYMNTEVNRPGREALTNTIVDYVGNFMRTGNPNGDHLPAWPAWSNAAGASKFITLDADNNHVITGVSNVELTVDGLINEMNDYFGFEIAEFILSFSFI